MILATLGVAAFLYLVAGLPTGSNVSTTHATSDASPWLQTVIVRVAVTATETPPPTRSAWEMTATAEGPPTRPPYLSPTPTPRPTSAFNDPRGGGQDETR